ncbi:alpha/beta fold hydrolase [Nocardia aurea]|uniref:alpha/beta fold hydrolase n=1 Tax=Nocardia aurea TaxID=2144174 RepID=UPI0033A9D090
MATVYVDNAGVRLHAIDNRRDGSGVPVLVVPGTGEDAEDYAWQLEALGDRRVVVVDVRGRGRSDAPVSGYTWQHHYGDVLAVMNACELRRPIVMGYSRGTPYAIGAALHADHRVAGLVINDYQARHVFLPPEAVERLSAMRVHGRAVVERMPSHVIEAVAAQSEEVSLWARLPELGCPVLVIRGGRRGSMVDDAAADRYRAAADDVEVVTLPERGHGLWSNDIPSYLAALTPFLTAVDQEADRISR